MKPKVLIITATLLLTTQLAFRSGDPIEFSRDVTAHSDRDVRHDAGNGVEVISSLTQGEILATLPYPKGGKDGIAIQVRVTAGRLQGKSYWVYYNPKTPWLKSASQNAKKDAPKDTKDRQITASVRINSPLANNSAVGAFSPGDHVVFLRDVNAHDDSDVRHDNFKNRIYQNGHAVTVGTKAQVLSDAKFPLKTSRGDAVQVKASNGDFAKLRDFWVYFTPDDPWLKKIENGKVLAEKTPQSERSPASDPTQPLTLSEPNSAKIEDMKEVTPPSTAPQHDLQSSVSPLITHDHMEEPRVQSGSFELIPTYEFSHLTVTDSRNGTQASIYSSSVLGADLSWSHFFSPESTGYFQARVRHYNLDQPVSVGVLSNATPTTWDFEAGRVHSFSESVKGSVSIGYGQILSLSGLTSSALSVDLIRVPRIGVGGSFLLSRSEDFESGLKAHAEVLLPGNADSYRSRIGNSEGFSLYATDHTFSASGGASLTSFSTDFSSSQEMSIQFQLGVSFDIFGRKKKKVQKE